MTLERFFGILFAVPFRLVYGFSDLRLTHMLALLSQKRKLGLVIQNRKISMAISVGHISSPLIVIASHIREYIPLEKNRLKLAGMG